MKTRRRLLALFFAILLLGSVALRAAAQSEEERYVQEIRTLLVVADLHLTAANDALLQCLENFNGCVSDSRLVVARLNLSRNGLVWVLNSVGSLVVPARYRVINDLVAQGLRDSISGIGFHIEGLQEGSLQKFEAGSSLTEVGRAELQGAIGLLNSTPPRSELETLILFVAIAISAATVVSVTVLLWWYRRAVRSSSVIGPAAKP